MPRVDTFNELPGKLTVHIYVDHLPPHFHVRSPSTNAKISLETLEVLRGTVSRSDLAEVIAWVKSADNRAKLEGLWSKLNEQHD